MISRLRTPLDLPILLFVVSALIGVWASYDPATSWRKFAMIVVAVLIYYTLIALRAAPQLIETVVWLFVFGCCALTLYFVTQHDYAAQPGKFGFITAIGSGLNRMVPQFGLHVSDPNITSGALEIGLPLAVALAASEKEKAKRQKGLSLSPGLVVSLTVAAFIAFGLVMTSSRGAWLALAIVGCIAVLAITAKNVLRRYALPIGAIVILAGVIVLLRLGDQFMPALESILGAIPAGETAVSRVELWGQAWGLVQDYYFTGSGLGVFPMILSTYALLIDVPFLTHVHNLYLQVWLEQGLLGFVAFIWLFVGFYVWSWKRQDVLNRLAWGGIAAVTVMMIHGMVDVLLYSSRGLPLMFLPMGVAIASAQAVAERAGTSNLGSQQQLLIMGTIAAVAAAIAMLVWWQPFAAVWYANLGSVEQTRVERAGFPLARRRVRDIRRSGNLSNAQADLEHALAFDPSNRTGNQRLGAIASARGDYSAAQRYLGSALARDPMNPTTSRLLADTYMAMGNKSDACSIAARPTVRRQGAWMFPLAECITR